MIESDDIIMLSQNANMVTVNHKSPDRYKKAIYKIAKFFKNEFSYDFIQYAEKENDTQHIAYCWIHPQIVPIISHMDDFRVSIIGATCFRYRKNYKNMKPFWGMQWMWLHPYFRDKGYFKKSYPIFKEKIGEFIMEPPFSRTMATLVNDKKYGYDHKKLLAKYKK